MPRVDECRIGANARTLVSGVALPASRNDVLSPFSTRVLGQRIRLAYRICLLHYVFKRCFSLVNAGIAQLVEQLICNLKTTFCRL